MTTNLDESGYHIQCFLADFRHGRPFGGITDHLHQKGTLVGRALEYFVEKSHRAGRVGQLGQPGVMQCCDEHSLSNTD
jgi:hypothetical protein